MLLQHLTPAEVEQEIIGYGGVAHVAIFMLASLAFTVIGLWNLLRKKQQ